jgi:hypothetical protein
LPKTQGIGMVIPGSDKEISGQLLETHSTFYFPLFLPAFAAHSMVLFLFREFMILVCAKHIGILSHVYDF